MNTLEVVAHNQEPLNTQVPARRLSIDSQRIFNHVLAAIQAAEEYDSTESEDYIHLMQAIIDEASFRREACRRTFAMTGT